MSSATQTNPGANHETLKRLKELGGEQFGGKAGYLQLQVGEVAGPLVHVKIEKGVKLTEESKPLDLHVAERDGEEIRMPASAIFRRNAEEADLKAGDEYHVARLENAIKTTGSKAQGKGKEMEVYAITVTKRAKKK